MILFALSFAAATGQAPVAKPVNPDDKIVCKQIVRTGTRMAGKRVCMSAYNWRLTETRAQREVTDLKSRSQVEGGPAF